METLIERGCGLDVHQATVVACLFVVPQADPYLRHHHGESLASRDWLLSQGCTHVALESTEVYGKPVYAVLEGGAWRW